MSSHSFSLSFGTLSQEVCCCDDSQVSNMQQLVLHMPPQVAAAHPMLTAAALGQHGLQLTMPHQLQVSGQPASQSSSDSHKLCQQLL